MAEMDHKDEEFPRADCLYKLAIDFSRMWGIMETMETIPNIGFENVRNISIGFAKEFLDSGEKDVVEFFLRKTNEIKDELT